MSDMHGDSTHCVLHIRPSTAGGKGLSDPSLAMDEMLRLLLPRVDETDNVYDGLARLCCGEMRAPRAAIVSMDCTGPAEMEFFSIVARFCREVAVYVYGGTRHQERMAMAIRLGARGPATESAIRALADDWAAAVRFADGRPTPPDPLRPPGDVHAVVVTDDVDDDNDEGPWSEEAGPDEDDGTPVDVEDDTNDDTPIRVPWLKYADRPTRTAPPRRAPSVAHTPQRDSDDGGGRAIGPGEPLLTDAELQALLGDDIAAIAPKPPVKFRSEQANDAGGMK